MRQWAKCSLKCIAAIAVYSCKIFHYSSFTLCSVTAIAAIDCSMQLCTNIWVNRPNVRWGVQLQMLSITARFFISFTLCSVTVIADIDCSMQLCTNIWAIDDKWNTSILQWLQSFSIHLFPKQGKVIKKEKLCWLNFLINLALEPISVSQCVYELI